MNAVHTLNPPSRFESGAAEVLRWNEIREAGCYLLVDSGGLVRIPSSECAPAFMPDDVRESTGGMWAARLSRDPAEMSSVLRAVAGRLGFPICF